MHCNKGHVIAKEHGSFDDRDCKENAYQHQNGNRHKVCILIFEEQEETVQKNTSVFFLPRENKL